MTHAGFRKGCVKMLTGQVSPPNNIFARTSAEVPVPLSVLLKADVFRNHILYAGEKEINRPIRRVTVSDMPDAAEWIIGGELICTTGYIFSMDSSIQSDWIINVARSGASAIVIKPSRFLGELPQQIIDAANAVNLPLIGVPNDVQWPNVIQQTMDTILSFQVKKLADSYSFHQRLDSLILSSSGLESILNVLAEASGNCSIFLADKNLAPIATSNMSDIDDALRQTVNTNLCEQTQRSGAQTREETTLFKCNNGYQIIVPVTAGKRKYGFLTAFPVDEEHITHVRMILDQGSTAVALELMSRYASTLNRSEQINQFIKDMLNRKAFSPADITRHGQEWGVNLNLPTVVMSLYCEPALTIGSLRNCIDIVREFDSNALLSSQENSVTLFYHPKNCAGQKLRQECRHLAYKLLSALKELRYNCSIGISEVFSIFDCSAFIRNFRGARVCIQLCRMQNDSILFCDDIGLMRIFPYIENWDAFIAMARSVLAPLAESDSSLIETLQAYISCGFRKTQAAALLNIHVNTLSYRLDKIEELLGIDMYDANSFLLLYVAAMATAVTDQFISEPN